MLPHFLRRLARDLLPPLLWPRQGDQGAAAGPCGSWEGVYGHLREVPARGPGFFDPVWADAAVTRAALALEHARRGGVAALPEPEHCLLPLLASLVHHDTGAVSVLDFGGGAGIAYLYVKGGLPADARIEYHVVEVPPLCARAAALHAGDPRIHFHPELPREPAAVDLVYMSDSLQYVEAYAPLLESLCRYRPRYVLLASLTAGDVPTFATAQTDGGGRAVTCWFFNEQEIVRVLAARQYALCWPCLAEGVWDQPNFPEAYRVRRPICLLFERAT